MRAKPAYVVREKGFGKIFNFVKKVAKSSLAKKLERLHSKNFQMFIVRLLIKFIMKKLKCKLQSDTANYLVGSAAAYGHCKL